MKSFLVYCTILLLTAIAAKAQMNPSQSLSEKQASHFAALALKCVNREFPNKPEHVINNTSEVKSPKALHPAFYGCYDWHSSVHGHWMLVRLLKTFPNLPESAQIRNALNANLTAEHSAGSRLHETAKPAIVRAHLRLGLGVETRGGATFVERCGWKEMGREP